MIQDREVKLKKLYTERLIEAGYKTVPELIQILPPSIMSITGSSISTAEKLFVIALKTHMKNVQLLFNGEPPDGINKVLSDLGYLTNHEIADANPTIIAQTLKISLTNAGDIVLYAMELTNEKEVVATIEDNDIIDNVDREISHYLGKLERTFLEKKLDITVEEAVQKIQSTIQLPEDDIDISREQKEEIKEVVEQFITVFPACTGFAIYNRRSDGIYSYSVDATSKATLAKINDTIEPVFWKIRLALEERNDYGWINTQPHLVWIEAIRDRSQKRQLAFVVFFIFESKAKESIGSATLTIKGITKEIERIIYSQVMTK
ncbi:MAG: hypothetical protein JXA54_05730 [Candidatus Heimdallarchaeota archaeon]|nr:hypothetical protein [Candidatus Heimdallarchaeota archaeon]